MKRRVTIIIALVLALVLSVSTALADFSQQKSMSVSGASAVGKSWISSNLRSAYAQTSGSTNAYVYVYATFDYASPSEGGASITVSGYSSVFVKKTPVGAPSDSLFYRVSSYHTLSYNGDGAHVSLLNEP